MFTILPFTRSWLGQGLVALSLSLSVLSSHAQQILIGQTAGFTGAAASGVKENLDGANLVIDEVNARGGIGGKRIVLLSLDDGFQPAKAALNARELVMERNVVALFLSRGTPHTEAMLPLINKARVPLIAPATGAMSLHQPVQPWVFNVRTSYQREAQKAVAHLATIGLNRIALWQVKDSFGADATEGAMAGFKQAGLQPVAARTFDRDKPDFLPMAQEVVKQRAQAVVFIGSSSAVAAGSKVLRTSGSRAQIVTLSNNASGGFIRQMGEHAHGTVVAQVFPQKRGASNLLVSQAQRLADAKGLGEVTPAMLEGFAGAKVLVEALRRAGPTPTRESIKAALETFNRFDLGGLEITFTPTNHSGLDYTDLSIIDASGRFLR